jgi:hypothetical protein
VGGSASRSIEVHVIHAASVAVSREHRRAKTDRLDSELLKRAFLGWLRGERDHCKMVAIPSIKDKHAKRPNRERESLVGEQSRIVNRMKATLIRLGIRRFTPYDPRTGVNIGAVPASLQDRREMWTATVTVGSPNDALGTETLERYHPINHLQRIALRRNRRKPLVRIEKSELPHRPTSPNLVVIS